MSYQEIFTDEEWGLLVGLPQSVLSAAVAAEDSGMRHTLAAGGAGLDAIGEGRVTGGPLVAEIATELIGRIGDPEEGVEAPVVVDPPDPQGTIQDCLTRARAARTLLAGRADEGDAGAYAHWLVTIAGQAVASVPAGAVFSLGGEEAVSAAEHRFVHRLAAVLRD